VWGLSSLKNNHKPALFAAPANVLKLSLHNPIENYSYEMLNKITNRATPEIFTTYKLATVYSRDPDTGLVRYSIG
jgi:hypothetical protein